MAPSNSSLEVAWNQFSLCIFVLNWEPNANSCVIHLLGATGGSSTCLVVYISCVRIRTLLNFAKQTSDPLFAAFLMEKAVHLKSQIEESPPARDISPAAPDVEPENRSR